MADYLKRSWAEIDLSALEYNVQQIQSRLNPGVMLMGVVKADAYGHGAKQIAKRMEKCGVNWFGVSNIEEGEELRACGIAQPVLIFGITPPELAGRLSQSMLTQAAYALEYAQALQECAAEQGVTVDCHLKLDTGMTRLGFLCDEESLSAALDEMTALCALPNLRVGGAFTHLAVADNDNPETVVYTRRQFERFVRATDALRERGISLPLRHCSNSAGVLSYPEFQLDMVRAGIILYGMPPSPQYTETFRLKPVMQLKSAVASVKEIPAGAKVSYGCTYTAPKPTTVAVVPIGYADGYQRGLSGKARMLVGGHYAPVIGRVCMDQTMLDVSGIPEVHRGDIVTVFGEQIGKTVPVEELADLLGSINYEFTCLISKRIPRVCTSDDAPNIIV